MKFQHQKPDETPTSDPLIHAADLFTFCVLRMIESMSVVRGVTCFQFPRVPDGDRESTVRGRSTSVTQRVRRNSIVLSTCALYLWEATSDLLSCTQVVQYEAPTSHLLYGTRIPCWSGSVVTTC